MTTGRRIYVLITLLLPALANLSCSVARDIERAMTNLSRCTFKLDNVTDFSLAGIPLGSKSNVDLADGVKLLAGFAQNDLPASFTLNVAAVNPNDGSGGTRASSATMTSFAWTLLLDSTVTINGDIGSPITIPGTGQQVLIPLRMQLNLVQFFKQRGYDHILNLALALGGVGGSPSRITLRAKPTIQTDLGPITYPGEIDIIDKEFR
jgi:hypothetical protein